MGSHVSNLVAYADLTNLAQDLTAIQGGSLQTNTKVLMASVLGQAEGLARAYAPVRTGALRGSIGSYTTNSGMSGVLYANSAHASFNEFGTGIRGEFHTKPIIIRARPGKYLRFTGKDGKVHFAKQVINPGMAPRPFMRPAIERVIIPLAQGLGDIAVLSVIHGPNAPETLHNAPATGWH